MYIPTGKLRTEEDDLHIFFLMLMINHNSLLTDKIKSYMIFSYDKMLWLEEFIKSNKLIINYTFCELDYYNNIITRTFNNFMYPQLLFLHNLPQIELDNGIGMLSRLLDDTRQITASFENQSQSLNKLEKINKLINGMKNTNIKMLYKTLGKMQQT